MRTSMKDAESFCFLSYMSWRAFMPVQWKPFLFNSFQANGMKQSVLLHGLPGHQIWPLSIFSKGYIKDLVYQTKVQDVDILHWQLTTVCDTVTTLMLQTLGMWWSGVWMFAGPPREQIRRSTEEHHNLSIFCIFQWSSHVSINISLGNIKFCYW
jgi:hypothetical protein